MAKEQNNSAFRTFLRGLLRFIAGLLCLAISAEAVLWLGQNAHPDSAVATDTPAQAKYDLSSRLDIFANNTKSDALSDLTYIEKIVHYTIEENALSAPKPSAAGYGSSTNPAEITALIAAHPLAEGKETAWDENVDFFPGQAFLYYQDETILVVCWKEIRNEKCCSCSEIFIADGSQIRRKLADDTYGGSVQLYASDMAAQANAVVAINGDFYAFRTLGVTVYQRQVRRFNPSRLDSCFFTADGNMLFSDSKRFATLEEAQQYVDDNDILFGLTFGPTLIENGELKYIDNYPIGEALSTYSRSCIGMLGDKHYFLMTMNQEGICTERGTVNELGKNMLAKGCVKAYVLDGGQTSVIVFNNKAFNRVDWGNERTMSDIIYFGTALPSQEG